MTLSNVSDWSGENEKPSRPQLLQDNIDEDEDDGMRLCEREKEGFEGREREREVTITPKKISCLNIPVDR